MVGVAASFVLGPFMVDTLFGLVAACIFLSTTITMCVVFVPKVRPLLRNTYPSFDATIFQMLAINSGDMSGAVSNTVADCSTVPGSSTMTPMTCENCTGKVWCFHCNPNPELVLINLHFSSNQRSKRQGYLTFWWCWDHTHSLIMICVDMRYSIILYILIPLTGVFLYM
jgi:hypothetical protein